VPHRRMGFDSTLIEELAWVFVEAAISHCTESELAKKSRQSRFSDDRCGGQRDECKHGMSCIVCELSRT